MTASVCPVVAGIYSPLSVMTVKLMNTKSRSGSKMTVNPHARLLTRRAVIALLPVLLLTSAGLRVAFSSMAACASLSSTSAFFAVSGGEGSVRVTAPGPCIWPVQSNDGWISITSGDSGTGTDVMTFVVRGNFTGAARTGTITVDGLTFTVFQDGGVGDACLYAISPKFQAFSSSGGTGTVIVTAANACAWQAVTKASWITIISGGAGIGNGTLTYTVASTSSSSGRSGTITIAGLKFSVKQKPLIQPSAADAARFLEQATWGPTDALITQLQATGFDAFLGDQYSAPPSSYPTLPLQPTTISTDCQNNIPPNCVRDNYSMYPVQLRFFTNAMYGQDQVRQRAAWALHKIMVVSGRDLMQPSWVAPYLQILDRNAFGNYRQLLYEITLNPGMGRYLDMVTSTTTNPNENYAREILQLFSIGLHKLNLDGTLQLDGQGNVIPTYDQSVVSGFAKVFTGWTFEAQPQPGVTNYIDPMVLRANNHDTGTKQLLNGVVQPANQTGVQDLNAALDNIFNHQNVGPFISKQLIQQLVASNPSPAYVARVAGVFNNNGSNVRGDLGAVFRAVLLDPEARGDLVGTPSYGHLREPVLLINNLLRAFNARSADGTTTSDGYLNPQGVNMDQDVFRPPTVFSYFPPDFVVTGTGGTVGPEFGVLSTSTTLRRANFVNTMAFSSIAISTNAPRGTSLDLSAMQALAGDPAALVDALNRVMMHGSMSAQMRTSIINAVNAVSSSNPRKRAQTAIYLIATSSQFQVER